MRSIEGQVVAGNSSITRRRSIWNNLATLVSILTPLLKTQTYELVVKRRYYLLPEVHNEHIVI
jgi:hypothetical protein